MKTKRTYYYSDLINDDFAGTNLKTIETPKDWEYISHNWFYKLCSFILYRLIMTPLAYILIRIARPHKIINRKVVKHCKGPIYLYINHTSSMYDAINPTYICFPRKNYIICHPDATSIKGIKNIVKMAGALPLPNCVENIKSFNDALNTIAKNKDCVTIYPEAHIWPYYEDIRPFNDHSFKYPIQNDAATFAVTNTYVERKIFKKLSPKIITYIDGPFYPNKELSLAENKKLLRDEVYDSMLSHTKHKTKLEYYKYLYKEGVKPYFEKNK